MPSNRAGIRGQDYRERPGRVNASFRVHGRSSPLATTLFWRFAQPPIALSFDLLSPRQDSFAFLPPATVALDSAVKRVPLDRLAAGFSDRHEDEV
jgi:hypothetical protein